MHSPARALFLSVNILLFALLVILGTPTAVTPAVAAPLAFLNIRSTDYAPSRQNTPTTPVVKHATPEAEAVKVGSQSSSEYTATDGHIVPRDINTVLGDINLLNNYYNEMSTHKSNLAALFQQESFGSSADYQAQSATELSAFRSNLAGFQDILAQLGADKGLANYNRDSDIETLLKNMVNAVKYTLSDIDEMVYELPAVGGTLGPLVYDIKCILDETLDAVENLTDAIWNAISPLLQNLISDASKTACNSGLAILGLCILP